MSINTYKTKTRELLLASNNPGKLAEIKALLQDLEVKLLTPSQLGLNLHVTEDGQTYADNAALKGLEYSGASGLITLVDDSGLEVDALNGQPGVRSARYAPQGNATDADRRRYLLQQLNGHPRPWTARFRCVVALATPARIAHFTEGTCLGEIIPEERGHAGFGYDPIFLFPDLGLTMAELTMDEKNRLSHRAKAVNAARPFILEMLSETT